MSCPEVWVTLVSSNRTDLCKKHNFSPLILTLTSTLTSNPHPHPDHRCVRHGAAACALLVCSRLRLCEHPPPRALLESLLRDALAVDAPAQRRVAQALILLTPTLPTADTPPHCP